MPKHSGFELVGDITPDSDNARNLGSSSKRFAEIHVVDGYIETASGEVVSLSSSTDGYPRILLNHTADEYHKGEVIFQKSGAACWSILVEGSGDTQHLDFSRFNPPGTWKDISVRFRSNDGKISFYNGIKTDLIEEQTSGSGITIGSNLKTNQAHLREAVSKSSGSTIANTDPDVITVDLSGSGDFTITLPSAADNEGREIVVVTLNSGMNLVVNAQSGEYIDGSSSKTYSTPGAYSVIKFLSIGGNNWVESARYIK